ncbi:uncharacterized protein LOC115304207 [Suricata suricatta]|uniref:uncharacterized protein LOC115304207 n=1 Tax=Suricata suricatta TaxID=37032 RepID=UPI0011558B7B|nr:uncharacterized protein LOC115304207 [Suricata suricatta]
MSRLAPARTCGAARIPSSHPAPGPLGPPVQTAVLGAGGCRSKANGGTRALPADPLPRPERAGLPPLGAPLHLPDEGEARSRLLRAAPRVTVKGGPEACAGRAEASAYAGLCSYQAQRWPWMEPGLNMVADKKPEFSVVRPGRTAAPTPSAPAPDLPRLPLPVEIRLSDPPPRARARRRLPACTPVELRRERYCFFVSVRLASRHGQNPAAATLEKESRAAADQERCSEDGSAQPDQTLRPEAAVISLSAELPAASESPAQGGGGEAAAGGNGAEMVTSEHPSRGPWKALSLHPELLQGNPGNSSQTPVISSRVLRKRAQSSWGVSPSQGPLPSARGWNRAVGAGRGHGLLEMG